MAVCEHCLIDMHLLQSWHQGGVLHPSVVTLPHLSHCVNVSPELIHTTYKDWKNKNKYHPLSIKHLVLILFPSICCLPPCPGIEAWDCSHCKLFIDLRVDFSRLFVQRKTSNLSWISLDTLCTKCTFFQCFSLCLLRKSWPQQLVDT